MWSFTFKAFIICWGGFVCIMLFAALYTSVTGGFSQEIEKQPDYTQDDRIYCEYARKSLRLQAKTRVCYKLVPIDYKE